MSDYNIKRTAAFAMCLAAIFGATALFYGVKSNKYEQNIISYHENSLSTLISSTQEMQQGLKNMQYGTNGVSLATSAARVWSASQMAKSSLSALPLNEAHLMQYEKLLNQAGDYALSIMSGASGGNKISQDNITALKSISESLDKVNEIVILAKEKADAGDLSYGGIIYSANVPSLFEELAKLEENFPKYNALNYDGVYSDHMSSLSPLYLEKMEQTNPVNALKTAAQLMGTDPENMTLIYETGGTIPAYGYGNDDRTIEITKNGGIILTLYDRRPVSTSKMSEDLARQKALQVAEKLGFSGLKCRYSSQRDNVLTVELVGSDNNVTIYPDRVTLGIALDNGQVVFLNSKNYVMSHTTRQLSLPDQIPDGATLALIPTEGQQEHLCYEYEEEDHLRFMCAETGSCYAIHPFEEGEKDGLISD